MNIFHAEEMDVTLWNNQDRVGLGSLKKFIDFPIKLIYDTLPRNAVFRLI